MRAQSSVRTLGAVLVLLSVAASGARAQSEPVIVFETVDAVEESSSGTIVTMTGIIQGQGQPTSVRLLGVSQGCRQQALLALSKPGKYLLRITNPTDISTRRCALVRNAG